MIVEIATGLIEQLSTQAAASPQAEICGLLLGCNDRIERATAAANVAARPADTFEIDPAALFAAYRAERAGGDRVLGHYHSHPGGSAFPSTRDRAAAEPGRLWLILGAGDARLWYVTETGDFEAVGIA